MANAIEMAPSGEILKVNEHCAFLGFSSGDEEECYTCRQAIKGKFVTIQRYREWENQDYEPQDWSFHLKEVWFYRTDGMN